LSARTCGSNGARAGLRDARQPRRSKLALGPRLGSDLSTVDAQGLCENAVQLKLAEPSGTTFEGFTVKNTGKRGLYVESASPAFVDITVLDAGGSGFAGGGLHISGGTVSLSGCTLSRNRGYSGGNLYIKNGAVVSLDDTEVSLGNADMGGGIYVESGALTVMYGLIEGNAATYEGGGLYVSGPYVIDITAVTWTANSAANGGALRLRAQASLYDDGCEFTDNVASYDGGAIYADDRVTLELLYTASAQNTSLAGSGGAVRVYGMSAFAADGILVEDNVAAYDGGALHVGGTATTAPSILSAYFARNVTDSGWGGGLYAAVTGSVSIRASSFVDGYAAWGGGGLRLDNRGTTTVASSDFLGNEVASGVGGAIAAIGNVTLTDSLSLSDLAMEDYTASSNGGALHATQFGTLSLTDSVLDNNGAGDSTSGSGGGA
jgi:predicted outer membrane repeat protein